MSAQPIIPLSRKAKRLIDAFEKASNDHHYEVVEGGYDKKRERMLRDKVAAARKKLEDYVRDLEVRDLMVEAALV